MRLVILAHSLVVGLAGPAYAVEYMTTEVSMDSLPRKRISVSNAAVCMLCLLALGVVAELSIAWLIWQQAKLDAVFGR